MHSIEFVDEIRLNFYMKPMQNLKGRHFFLLQGGTPSILKKSHFGQQYGLQSLTLTSYVYKSIYDKVIYFYFMKEFFKTNLFI